MLSVAGLPQPQEEEGSQEEARYRRHAEVLGLSRSPAGCDPSLQPVGCGHHPLFRCNPFQGRYCFETLTIAKNPPDFKAGFNPFQGRYCFETPPRSAYR